MTLRSIATRGLVGALALVGPAPAQAPTAVCELRLAHDPYRRGPPAWVAARTGSWMSECAGAVPPQLRLAAMVLRYADGAWSRLPASATETGPSAISTNKPQSDADEATAYVVASLRYGSFEIRAVCDFDGRERWSVRRSPTGNPPPPTSIETALAALGIADDGIPIVIDTAAWLAHFATPSEGHTGANTDLLLAAACGPTTLLIRPGTAPDRDVVYGRSDGGLLLPALLTIRSERAHPSLPPAVAWSQRHELRATTRLDLGAVEATRQLAGRAARTGGECSSALGDQLFALDERRAVAAAGFLRSGVPWAWRRVADLAPGSDPLVAELQRLATSMLAGAAETAPGPATAPRHPHAHQTRAAAHLHRFGLLGGSILAAVLLVLMWYRARMRPA